MPAPVTYPYFANCTTRLRRFDRGLIWAGVGGCGRGRGDRVAVPIINYGEGRRPTRPKCHDVGSEELGGNLYIPGFNSPRRQQRLNKRGLNSE